MSEKENKKKKLTKYCFKLTKKLANMQKREREKGRKENTCYESKTRETTGQPPPFKY